MRPKGFVVFFSAALGLLVGVSAPAQQAPPKADSGLPVGPATVAPHWSKYDYPKSIPEGAPYHIVERGDTLWDLSKRYLGNPYLWPQLWDQNRYVRDAHWIYPGDPLVLPKIALLSDQAGAAVADGAGLEDGEGAPITPEAGAGSVLFPVSEEVAVQCAQYLVPNREDEDLKVIGSEEGNDKYSLSSGDILYLGKGSNGGVKTGDVYSIQRSVYKVKHPVSSKGLGSKVTVRGWGRVVLVTDDSASLMVEQACDDIEAGDYLRPFERVNVPVALRRPPADRLTPPSGKASGYVVDLNERADVSGTNGIVSIDIGSEAGLTPGNILSVYRIVYPKKPTPRNVVGELAVLTVREQTATAKIMYSRDAIVAGDQVELR